MIDATTYATWRAICDKAEAYAESVMSEGGTTRKRNYLTAEEAPHPDYAACNNDIRGAVEQYEILRDMPEKFVAYVANDTDESDASGCRRGLETWAGDKLGTCRLSAAWRVRSHYGQWMYQIDAAMTSADGIRREYTGRGFGSGMVVSLRETAASRRRHPRSVADD